MLNEFRSQMNHLFYDPFNKRVVFRFDVNGFGG
jgi:hypothetical protein